MNPSNNSNGFELPVVAEAKSTQSDIVGSQESVPVSIEIQPRQVAQPAINPIAITTPPQLVNPPKTPTTDDSASSSVNLQIVKDKDLIDKEWVNKAKAIVEKNRDDPHKQSD